MNPDMSHDMVSSIVVTLIFLSYVLFCCGLLLAIVLKQLSNKRKLKKLAKEKAAVKEACCGDCHGDN